MSKLRDPSALLAARRSVLTLKNRTEQRSFADFCEAAAAAPLTEILPAAPGDSAAATGFALAWAISVQNPPSPVYGRGVGGEGSFDQQISVHRDAAPSPLTPLPHAGEGNRPHPLQSFASIPELRAPTPYKGAVNAEWDPIIWAAPETSFAEDGAPNGDGLAEFGVNLGRLLLVRAKTQTDALWATEEALSVPRAFVLCTIAPAKKPLSLTASRRLLLTAEKHGSRCALLRLDALAASAAWMRWSIAAAPSIADGRELGAPTFAARLLRNRAGRSGLSWVLRWNGHERSFNVIGDVIGDIVGGGSAVAMDGDLPAAPADRQAEAERRRAV